MTPTLRQVFSVSVLVCLPASMSPGQQAGATHQQDPAPLSTPVAAEGEEFEAVVDGPSDEEIEQLIAQAEGLSARDSPASAESVALIREELEGLQAGLALKASRLEAGEDVSDADLEIASRVEALEAAIATAAEEGSSDASLEEASSEAGGSPSAGASADRVGLYVDQALGILTRIRELLDDDRDETAAAAADVQEDSAPSDDVVGDVTGVITESGEAVEGVRVTDPETGVSAVTDADGQYTLEDVPGDRSAHLVLTKDGSPLAEGNVDLKPGHARVADFDLKESGTGPSRPPMKVLPAIVMVGRTSATGGPTGLVTGTVRDAEGKPLPRALVVLEGLGRARSNSKGRYSFLRVPYGAHRIRVIAPGRPSRTEAVRVSTARTTLALAAPPAAANARTTGKPLVRKGAGTHLTGAITNAAGQPVRAARVRLIQAGRAMSVRSGARGTFAFKDLEPGSYRMLVSKAGFRSATGVISLEPGTRLVRDYRLDRRAAPARTASTSPPRRAATPAARTVEGRYGAVVGRVVDIQTRRAIRGATVTLQGHEPARTNAAGSYRVTRATAGRHRLNVRTRDFLPVERLIRVSPGRLTRLDLALRRGHSTRGDGSLVRPRAVTPTLQLVGKVVDAATGRPIADAMVSAGAVRARTDRAGMFTVSGLSRGPHRVVVRADGYRPASRTLTAGPDPQRHASITLVRVPARQR